MTRYNFMGESFDFLKENKWIKRMALGLAILFITMTITGSLADHFTPSYTTYETTYEQILRMYLKMINRYGKKNNERHDLFNDAVYGGYDPENGDEAIINMTKRDAGYMLYDVNQDGIDELLIGTGGSWLYEVYTMDNGRVRELIRAGAYGTASSVYSCALLSDGRLFRFAHDGAALDYYEIWQMNGTGEASFVEGYHTDIIWDSETEDGIGVWYRSYAPFTKISDSSQTRVKDSIAEKWVRTQEQNIFDKKFVPFSIYEKYPDDPWNIAVISVKGSTETTAKVKIRKEAESNAKLVATKPAGTYVRVISQEGEYFRISFGNKEGFVQQQYLTPLTYEIQPGNNTAVYDDTATRETAEGQSKQANGTEENDQDVVAEDGDTYPANGKTNVGKVNIRSEMNNKSKLVATVQKKGTSVTVLGENADSDGVMWYKIGYNQKEGYVRSKYIDIQEAGPTGTSANEELYGLVIKKLATRSGPSPRAEDTGTYSLKGKRIRVYTRAYDPIENAWWVKCDVPYHGEIRTLWAWYTRFDSKTLPLESIPIDEEYKVDEGGTYGKSVYKHGEEEQISLNSTINKQTTGYSVSSDADTTAEKGEKSFGQVVDHYESVEVQRARQVLDHYEVYYTYHDDGKGTFVEKEHTRPVYKTEYYTETIQQPVYR